MDSKTLLASMHRPFARLAALVAAHAAARGPGAPRRADEVYDAAQAIRTRIDAALAASRRE